MQKCKLFLVSIFMKLKHTFMQDITSANKLRLLMILASMYPEKFEGDKGMNLMKVGISISLILLKIRLISKPFVNHVLAALFFEIFAMHFSFVDFLWGFNVWIPFS